MDKPIASLAIAALLALQGLARADEAPPSPPNVGKTESAASKKAPEVPIEMAVLGGSDATGAHMLLFRGFVAGTSHVEMAVVTQQGIRFLHVTNLEEGPHASIVTTLEMDHRIRFSKKGGATQLHAPGFQSSASHSYSHPINPAIASTVMEHAGQRMARSMAMAASMHGRN